MWKSVVDMDEMENRSAPETSVVLDSVTVGEESLIMESSNDVVVAEKRKSIDNKGVAFHQCSFVEKAEHSHGTSQGWRGKIEIQESSYI